MFFQKLLKCLFLWNIQPAHEETIRQSQAILAFSDSKMKDGSPGEGNRIIARTAITLRECFLIPILAQEEVAAAGSWFEFAFIARGNQRGISTLQWNTATITEKFARTCRENKWRRVVIVTTPAHLGRAIWVAERYGLYAVAAPMPQGNYFHKDLALWACRGGEWRFRIRELAVRLFFLLRGDI